MCGEGRPSPIGIRLRSGTLLKDLIRAVNTPLPHRFSPSEFLDSDKEEDNTMGGRPPSPRTLKDLTSPNLDQQPLCIQLNETIELKPQLINLIPKSRGLAGEGLNRHLQQFHHVVTSMKQATADADTTMMTTFPFSLIDTAGEWFFFLPSGSITTWNGMKKLFPEKYFPASRAEYFYEGLLSNDRNLIDAASSGALTNKNIAEATSLLENMAANTHQLYTRSEPMVRKLNEVGDSSHLEHRMGNIERMMQQIVAAIIPSSHSKDVEKASVIYANKQVVVSNPPFNQQVGYQFLQRPQQEAQGMSIDDKLNLILNTIAQDKQHILHTMAQDNQKAEIDMKDTRTQMGQLDTTVSKLEAQAAEKLPSQLFNHKENVSAIELRSGKQVEKPETPPESHECDL
ncbi:uncharacterized protein LOC113313095 [Papaver somniferum]|uniref:uncharacterized protein LOC113313095 n=1 Tax=Papaver somniferum TaxID=3469 RepID=UPI000E6FBF76|nr:uncharacterized protein LOC113313095 [Papaver somniferum]